MSSLCEHHGEYSHKLRCLSCHLVIILWDCHHACNPQFTETSLYRPWLKSLIVLEARYQVGLSPHLLWRLLTFFSFWRLMVNLSFNLYLFLQIIISFKRTFAIGCMDYSNLGYSHPQMLNYPFSKKYHSHRFWVGPLNPGLHGEQIEAMFSSWVLWDPQWAETSPTD